MRSGPQAKRHVSCNVGATHLERDALVAHHADPPVMKLKDEDGRLNHHGKEDVANLHEEID